MTHFIKKLEPSLVQKQKLTAIVSTPLNFKKLQYCLAGIDGSSRFSREKQDFV